MNRNCPNCHKEVSFAKAYRQCYNTAAGKFWSAFVCEKCGSLVDFEEESIGYGTLLDRHGSLFRFLFITLIAIPLALVGTYLGDAPHPLLIGMGVAPCFSLIILAFMQWAGCRSATLVAFTTSDEVRGYFISCTTKPKPT